MKLLHTAPAALLVFLTMLSSHVRAEKVEEKVVRIAELEIDPLRVEAYRAALKEEIEASIRIEPGVLSLHAVAIKGHPSRIRIMEVYANDKAYRSHLETPHFLKYKTSTQDMVKSLNLLETDLIMLGSK